MTEPAAQPAQRDPWERFGTVFASVWLSFLIFQLVAAWQAPLHLGWRLLGIALTLAFGVVYVLAIDRVLRNDLSLSAWSLGLLVVLAVGTAPIIGLVALGFGIFCISFTMFAFSPRVSPVVGVALLLAMSGFTVVLGGLQEWWFLLMIGLAVLVSTGATRHLGELGERHEAVRRQLALASERERVARDVHDLLGHTLTAITVKAELASRLIDSEPDKARDEVDEIRSLAREAISEVRSTVGSLRARRLDAELTGASAALADADVQLHVLGEVGAVDPRLRVLFAWAVREATTNVVRHASATRCTVTLERERLIVSDDGRGIQGASEGHGLRGLRERIVEAGGSLTVTDANPGTRVEVTM